MIVSEKCPWQEPRRDLGACPCVPAGFWLLGVDTQLWDPWTIPPGIGLFLLRALPAPSESPSPVL